MKGINMKKYLQLIRVKQWIKNVLVFVPMISARMLNVDNLLSIIMGFFAFSFACSFIYIINDIRDIEKDKLHPRKKNRPLPSGKIKKNTAFIIAIVMLFLSLCINFFINKTIFSLSLYLLLAYIIINIVLRVYYGASILDILVSNWLFLTIMSASLFLGLGKRKKEIINSKESRKVLEEYNEAFLDKFQYLSLALTLVFYSLWAMEQTNSYLVFSIPLIIIIFMRYSLIIEKSSEGDPSTILYEDKFLLGLCLIYGLVMFLLLVVI